MKPILKRRTPDQARSSVLVQTTKSLNDDVTISQNVEIVKQSSTVETSSDLLFIARAYVAMGFSVIPIQYKGKKPSIPSWKKYQSELPTDAELREWFPDGKKMNIGIVTGAISGITVVDFDTEEAISDAEARESLTCGPIVNTSKGLHAYCKYVDGHRNLQDKAGLPGIDIRAEGGYVVAPPSVHESGYVYALMECHGFDQPLPIVPEWVIKKPEKKSGFQLPDKITSNRNDTLFRYACSLRTSGMDEEGIWVRIQEVNQTRCYEPLLLPELETLFNSAMGQHEVPEWVEKLNKDYFVSREANKTFVFREQYDPELERKMLVRSNFGSFRDFHNNRKVPVRRADGALVMRPRGTSWLVNEHRRQYEGVILAPPGLNLPDGYYNLWKGYGVEPVKGCWKLTRDHLFHVVCSGNEVYFRYLMGWLATCVQNPSKQAEVAAVLRGAKGSGKGFLGVCLCKIFGTHSLHISSAKHLVGNFNSHLRGTIFLFADESFWAGDKQHESVLKALITEPTLAIEPKGVDVIQVRNMLHIMMASNSDWVVPASRDERRYFLLDVSDKHAQSEEYFKPLFLERDNGGLSAMLFDLLEYDLSGFNIRNVPQTDALAEQKIQSLDPIQMWWYGYLRNNLDWENRVPCAKLFNEYIAEVSQVGQRRSQETIFGRAMKKLMPQSTRKGNFKSNYGSYDGSYRQISHYLFPSLEECQDHFSKIMKFEIDWE